MADKISFKPLDNLAHDVPAALVVFLVAVPLCLGIALASGAPLFSGLLAGMVGGIVAGSLSGSPVGVSGPAAGLATIVLASIQELQSFPLFLTAVVLAGALQLLLGFLRAGTIGHFFPVAVIKGRLAGIGLTLMLKQIPHALGYDADFEGDESFFQPDNENSFTEIIQALQHPTPGAVIVAVVSLLILISWSTKFFQRFRWTSYVPGPLVVVILGIGLNYFFGRFAPGLVIQDSHLVNLGGFDGLASLPQVIQFPDFAGLTDVRVWRIAGTIALVASIESLLSTEASDKLDRFRRITPLNQELKAQGVSNLLSGLIGGLPVTAVIVRSSANIMAGARTRMSAILHGIFLVVVVFAAPTLLQQIPLASLAGVLLIVGFKLNTPELYRQTFKKGWDQFLPFLVTIVAILFTDLLIGITIGLLISIFFVLKTNFQTAMIIVNDDSKYLIRFTKDVSFLHKSKLRKTFEKIPPKSSVIIDGTKSQFIDMDIVETIEDFLQGASANSIEVELKRSPNAQSPLFRLEAMHNGQSNTKSHVTISEP